MSTEELTPAKLHGHRSVSTREKSGCTAFTGRLCARKPLLGGLTAAEAGFYAQYSWSLNAFPTIREVVNHLSKELDKLECAQEDWQQSEVITNVFLLSCAIT